MDGPHPCSGKTRLFYESAKASVATAKALCAPCVNRKACLDYAMETRKRLGPRSDWGVWGGTTPDERDVLLAGRRVVKDRGKVDES